MKHRPARFGTQKQAVQQQTATLRLSQRPSHPHPTMASEAPPSSAPAAGDDKTLEQKWGKVCRRANECSVWQFVRALGCVKLMQ